MVGIEDSGGASAGPWRGRERDVFASAGCDVRKKKTTVCIVKDVERGAGTRIDIQ
jgi:hypothetical protein